MANIVNFTDKQFENRLNDNLEELVQGKKAVESPTAFLLGGQPGSGKTSLRSAISEETQGNVVIIDNDTFKQQHPRSTFANVNKRNNFNSWLYRKKVSGDIIAFGDWYDLDIESVNEILKQLKKEEQTLRTINFI